jgi:hypothetical protein
MKPSQVQSHVAAKIAAVPALNALGAPFIFTGFTDEKVREDEIAARLRETGVSFEIGAVDAKRSDEVLNRRYAGEAEFEIFVAESPTVAHALADWPLCEAVIEAVCSANEDRHVPVAQWQSTDSGKTEHGYVLHVIAFTQKVVIP